MRRAYIVSYDIADEKRLRRVFRICKDHGDHLQYSVFECLLSGSERVLLEGKLKEAMNRREDQVLFVDLGPADDRSEAQITALGQPYVRCDAPCIVV